MVYLLRAIPTIVLSLVMVLGVASLCLAEDTAKASTKFVDLDGDGIDDNARDLDEDGIPDVFTAKTEEPQVQEVQYTSAFGMEGDLFDSPTTEVKSSKSADFGARRFSTRALSNDRAGIESADGFGPGCGVGSGAVKTPVCVGGVCHW